ncbi:hypothetical protein ACNAW0_19750 [Micromonospora sp. SL1-18]|uniref:hypothetical protein n=1 Tax=Micromonospora sp. SL1-18 TaxID=3399128 RepID=UPI003A4D22F5
MVMQTDGRDDQLPGGLDVWQARWLLVRNSGVLWPTVLGAIMALLVPYALPLFAVIGLGVLTQVRFSRRGALVTEEGRHELHALVATAAARLGTPMPDRIWMTAEASVKLTAVAGRRHLLIGLPLLTCLSAAELRALVGYQLALLRHRRPGLLARLRDLWTESVEMASAEEGQLAWRAATTRANVDRFAGQVQREADGVAVSTASALARFAGQVQQEADAAAATAAGSREVAARAFALAETVGVEYDGFLDNSGVPPKHWWQPSDTSISDVHDGWSRAVAYGLGETTWDEEAAEVLATVHPGLADPIRALGTDPLPVLAAADPMAVAPPTVREQRRMVRQLRGIPYPRVIRWRTYDQSPPSWWRRRAARDAKSVRADVAAVLDRRAVDDVEVFEVVRTRLPEVTAAALGVPVEELEDHPHDCLPADDLPTALIWLVEDHLLHRGWRLDHPAVRGVLVGSDGERVDVRAVLADAVRANGVTPVLRDWLSAPGR